MAAILEGFNFVVVEKQKKPASEVFKLFNISDSVYYRHLRFSRFVKKYNLIIYSGASFTSILRWLPELQDYFEKEPHEAYFFSGNGLSKCNSL